MQVFFLWMLVSSGLGFAKLLTLARVLPPADFGHYVTLFGAATLSGTLLSFGLVEATVKQYPRMWVAGGSRAILVDGKQIAATVAKRFAAATVLIALLAAVLDLGYSPVIYGWAGLIGLGTSMIALVASILRASDSSDGLRKFSVVRTALAFVVVVPAAWFFHWEGAIAAEAIGQVLCLWHARALIRSAYPSAPAPAVTSADPQLTSRGVAGTKLYIANLFSSSTLLADRSFINVLLGPVVAGSYGVLAVLFQIGQLLSNILAQRVGPLVIKAGVAGDQSHGSFARMRTYGLLLALAMTGLVIVLLLARAYDIPAGFFGKYQISNLALVLAGVVGLLQVYGLLEFYLLARDRENAVLAASIISSVCFFASFTVAGALRLPLEWFLAFACVARLMHVTMLSVAIKTRPQGDG